MTRVRRQFGVLRSSTILLIAALLIPTALFGADKKPQLDKKKISTKLKKGLDQERLDSKRPTDQPAAAQRFFVEKRVPQGETYDPVRRMEAAAAALRLPLYSTSLRKTVAAGSAQRPDPTSLTSGQTLTNSITGRRPESWQPLGPGNVGGRTRALLIHPEHPNVMWTAGVAGGIWKSTNGGASWIPKADLLANIAVNSMILEGKDAEIIYAGTGEGFFNADAVRGGGIYRSRDGGESWKALPSTLNNSDFYYVNKLARGGKKRLYAATRAGVMRSDDTGATWTKVLDQASVGGCMDLAVRSDDDDDDHDNRRSLREDSYIFAGCGTYAGGGAVWRALDSKNAATWEKVLEEPNMGRVSLAIAPSNNDYIYAMVASADPASKYVDGLYGIFRSTNRGAAGTWEARVRNTDANKLNTVQLSNPVYAFYGACFLGDPSYEVWISQGWYDNQIAVDPKDANIVWTAGIDLMRSDDGGKNWGLASYWWLNGEPGYSQWYAHADNHTIVFHPRYNGKTNRTMFVGSDGGVFKTDNARAAVSSSQYAPCADVDPANVTWKDLNNGYEVTQFYHGATYPNGATFFGGTQDNGTPRGTLATGANHWESIRGGDGGYVAVNPTNTNQLYGEYYGLSFERSDDGGANWADKSVGINEPGGNFLFIVPFAMDPSNANRMWIGGAYAWRSDNSGDAWTRASAFFGTRVSAWGVAPTNSDKVYVGTQTGRILTVANASSSISTTVWPFVTPRAGYVSSIGVHPSNQNIAYATYSTFNTATAQGHLFKTIDGGTSWTRVDVDSSLNPLPDVPAHVVVVDPTNDQRLYVGTDIGVFISTDGGANWARENTGFANVITEHLEYNATNGYLYAFTHGRSAWRVKLAN
jgi:photosystem II stability/assembly factor-like uncharacterized protein